MLDELRGLHHFSLPGRFKVFAHIPLLLWVEEELFIAKAPLASISVHRITRRFLSCAFPDTCMHAWYDSWRCGANERDGTNLLLIMGNPDLI